MLVVVVSVLVSMSVLSACARCRLRCAVFGCRARARARVCVCVCVYVPLRVYTGVKNHTVHTYADTLVTCSVDSRFAMLWTPKRHHRKNRFGCLPLDWFSSPLCRAQCGRVMRRLLGSGVARYLCGVGVAHGSTQRLSTGW